VTLRGYEKVGEISSNGIGKLLGSLSGIKWKHHKAEDRDFFTCYPEILTLGVVCNLGILKNCFAISIPPGGVVHKHTDPDTNSYHIPLETNDNAFNYMGDTANHLEVGFIYKVDRSIEHYSVNGGEKDRIHLILVCE